MKNYFTLKHYTTFKPVFLLVVFLFSYSVYGQQGKVTYFDANWKKCEQYAASFYRKVEKKENKHWKINDYYIDGSIQMTGYFKKRSGKIKDGHFVYYYRDGQNVSEGDYKEDKRTGLWTFWFENGQKKSEGSYKDGKKTGYWTYWYESGNKDKEGTYSDGKKDGKWRWYFENGKLSSEEDYKHGSRIGYHFFDDEGNEVSLEEAEHLPSFPGGKDSLAKFMKANLRYPDMVKAHQGRVVVKFIVDKSGKISDYEIYKSAYRRLNEEALRVVGIMPDFVPAKRHNRVVKAFMLFPIRFTYYK